MNRILSENEFIGLQLADERYGYMTYKQYLDLPKNEEEQIERENVYQSGGHETSEVQGDLLLLIEADALKSVNEIKITVIHKPPILWFILFILALAVCTLLAGLSICLSFLIAINKWKHETGVLKWLKVIGLSLTGPISLPIMVFMGTHKVEGPTF